MLLFEVCWKDCSFQWPRRLAFRKRLPLTLSLPSAVMLHRSFISAHHLTDSEPNGTFYPRTENDEIACRMKRAIPPGVSVQSSSALFPVSLNDQITDSLTLLWCLAFLIDERALWIERVSSCPPSPPYTATANCAIAFHFLYFSLHSSIPSYHSPISRTIQSTIT